MKPRRSEQAVFAWVFILAMVAIAGLQAVSRWDARLDTAQRIRAQLVAWGLFVDGLESVVDPDEVDRRIAFLESNIPEARVQAARWLAAHGVRGASDAIAASMRDAGTLRPCQLAHSLGQLGDERWVDTLAEAVRQPSNTDLRVCATMALGELASPRAVTALIDAYRDNITPTTALTGLGNIAHPSAAEFLQQVFDHPRNDRERHAAGIALEKIQMMDQADRVPALIERVQTQLAQGQPLDRWALRQLAERSDPRTPEVMRRLLVDAETLSENDRVAIAAVLVAQGEPGRKVLAHLSRTLSADKVTRSIASAAMRLMRTSHESAPATPSLTDHDAASARRAD
ncbi:MAG: hypothetical protein GC162_00510 [Planctomycetes bacterium]|nr:hypothetical protein [Planctomycetota bacterium]